jgi:membrane dipeptidase
MMSRRLSAGFQILAFFVFSACASQQEAETSGESELVERAESIHERVLTLDAHIDIEVSFFTPEKPGAMGHQKLASLPGMKHGGLDSAFFAVYVEHGPLTPEGFENAHNLALEKIQTIHHVAENEIPDEVEIAIHPDELQTIHQKGKIAAVIAMENGYPVGEDIENIEEFYDLGVRYLTLSHIGHNQICDSNLSQDERISVHDGLSPFGEEVVTEMNRLGMIIDVSHIAKSSVLDVLRLSKAPVIASHSSHKIFCGMDRMWDDEQLLALKENGGVFHLVGLQMTVKPEPPEKTEAIRLLRMEFDLPEEYWPFFLAFEKAPPDIRSAYDSKLTEIESEYPSANVEDFVDHIDYLVDRMGIDHVGISSDFYDRGWCLDGWKDASETFNITLGLVRRGYTEEDIAKIWSGNTLRVWHEAEKAAALVEGS